MSDGDAQLPSVEEEVDGDRHLLTISFINQSWLDTFQFNIHTLLDYFRTSQFWTDGCNNEVLLMQNRPMTQLKSMVGVEYAVVQDAGCFLINKQIRRSPDFAELLQVYYIVSEGEQGVLGTIYQLPDMNAVLRGNVDNAMHSLQAVVASLTRHTQPSASGGQHWALAEQEKRELARQGRPEEEKEEKASRSSASEQQGGEQEVYDRLVANAFHFVLSRHAPPPHLQ